jgi:TRAP-type C4-dicarboxylate transport system permease small subunit
MIALAVIVVYLCIVAFFLLFMYGANRYNRPVATPKEETETVITSPDTIYLICKN